MAMRISPPDPLRSMWTVADLEQLPDDGHRYEVLHGELLMTPMPTVGHQRAAMCLILLIGAWCRRYTGWLILAPGGVYMSETTWLEPDLAVYPEPEATGRSWREMPPPMLVVEVLSPSTRKRDRFQKRPAYLAHGVVEVWIVDEAARSIERWTARSEFPELLLDGITWSPVEEHPPLVISSAEVFGA